MNVVIQNESPNGYANLKDVMNIQTDTKHGILVYIMEHLLYDSSDLKRSIR